MRTLVATPDPWEPDDAIEAFLDRLQVRLFGHPRHVRRILAESEAHLREAQERAVDEGMHPDAAARYAVMCFGSPAVVAKAYRRSSLASPLARLLSALAARLSLREARR